jgi:hypothetical protein
VDEPGTEGFRELDDRARDERKETELIGRSNCQSLPDSGGLAADDSFLRYHLRQDVY